MSAKHPNATVPPAPSTPEVPGIPNRPFPLKRVIGALLAAAVAVAVAALLWPKSADAADAVGLDAQAGNQVKRIQVYLNDIETMTSRFTQITDQGHFAEGRFYMDRPGRMRIEYDPPTPVLIVSDGTWVMYKDEELDQISHMPFNEVPAAMFVGERVDFFGDDLQITDYQNQAGVIRVTLRRTEDPRAGSLTLVFEADPIALRKWSVVDAQGMTTTVSLLDPEFGRDLGDDLFRMENRPPPQARD